MKMPALYSLIANPNSILKTKMPKCRLDDSFNLTHYLLITIFKRLNTYEYKRVLSEYK